jgi:hypothetical protein
MGAIESGKPFDVNLLGSTTRKDFFIDLFDVFFWIPSVYSMWCGHAPSGGSSQEASESPTAKYAVVQQKTTLLSYQ